MAQLNCEPLVRISDENHVNMFSTRRESEDSQVPTLGSLNQLRASSSVMRLHQQSAIDSVQLAFMLYSA